MNGWLLVLLAIVIAWVLLSLGSKKEPVEPAPEAPKPPSGAGIEKRVIRQIVQTPDGGEIVLSEMVKYAGVDEAGQLVDEQEERFVTLGCEHVCRDRNGYGGKCRSCGTTHCILTECATSCVKCGALLTGRTETLGKR
jgi:hypothetical protein